MGIGRQINNSFIHHWIGNQGLYGVIIVHHSAIHFMHNNIRGGHLCDHKHPPITEAEAQVYLARDLMTALNATQKYCPELATEHEKRLAAIVDFTFNLGAGRLQTSPLWRRINQRDWSGATQELRRWVNGGGKVLPGLVVRREAEIALVA